MLNVNSENGNQGDVSQQGKQQKAKKPIFKKWWFWVIIAVVFIGIIGSGSSGDDSTGNSDSQKEQMQSQVDSAENKETTTKRETTTEKTKFYKGDPANDGILKIKYVSAQEYKGYNQYSAPKYGNKIIKVEFAFENTGDADTYLNTFHCYADNAVAENYYYVDDSLDVLTQISAGRTHSGSVYFEVPKDAENIEVEYEINAWNDKKAIFVIELDG